MRRIATITALGLAAVVLTLLLCLPAKQQASVAAAHPIWIEMKWPFLMDQWGQGKAFQCKAADCGAELALYIRPKIGFCSSTTGVADDTELERLSDFDFMNGKTAALGQGHDIKIAWMKGRLRAYEITGPMRARTMAMSIAYNNDSDALVATVLLKDAQPETVEPAVIEFLNGAAMQTWTKTALGM